MRGESALTNKWINGLNIFYTQVTESCSMGNITEQKLFSVHKYHTVYELFNV